MVATVNLSHACHHHDLVPTRQPSQSIGGSTMHQGLASDQWLLYLWSPHLVAYYIEEDLHPILSDTNSYLFKHFCFHRKDKCMRGPKPTVTNRASRYFFKNRPEWQRRSILGQGNHFFFTRDSASWNKAFTLWYHWLHAAEVVLRAGVTSLTMRAGARFTVSPFNWPSWMVRFVVLGGGVCCVVVLVFVFFTGPISLHS